MDTDKNVTNTAGKIELNTNELLRVQKNIAEADQAPMWVDVPVTTELTPIKNLGFWFSRDDNIPIPGKVVYEHRKSAGQISPDISYDKWLENISLDK